MQTTAAAAGQQQRRGLPIPSNFELVAAVVVVAVVAGATLGQVGRLRFGHAG